MILHLSSIQHPFQRDSCLRLLSVLQMGDADSKADLL